MPDKIVYLITPPHESPSEFDADEHQIFEDFHKANDEACKRSDHGTDSIMVVSAYTNSIFGGYHFYENSSVAISGELFIK